MDYYLVCDGGGTKTDSLLFDGAGNVLAWRRKGGSNALFIDPALAAENVHSGIREALAAADISLDQVARIALFIPGFQRSLPRLVEQLGRDDLLLLGDRENALYTAFGERRGIVVLSGTGSFAIGSNARGVEITVGGWGPLFGDEGSGYHIGVLALGKVAHLHDAAQGGSVLERLLLDAMQIATVDELRRAAYAPEFTRARIAALAPIVAEAYRQGDPHARAILLHAADALAQQAHMIANRLAASSAGDSSNDELTSFPVSFPVSLPVSLIGGVTHLHPDLPDHFARALNRRAPHLVYQAPLYEPIVGSALYLLDAEEEIAAPNRDLAAAGKNLMRYRTLA